MPRLHLFPPCLRHCAQVGPGIRVHLAETGEIGILQQQFRSLVHGLKVERHVHLPTVSAPEGVLLQMDEIVVGATGGREAGVHVFVHRFDAMNGNIRGKQLVQLVTELVGVEGSGMVEMRHHAGGVYACVRTSRAHHLHGPTQQDGQRLLQCLLHTGAVGLYLPAVVGRAVKRQVDEIPHVRCFAYLTGMASTSRAFSKAMSMCGQIWSGSISS